jgi:hypothetical protein
MASARAEPRKTGESYSAARSQLLAGAPGTPTAEWMLAALHVTNGDATDLAGTWLARRVLYWRDALHEGPVPAVGPEELRRIRAEFLGDDTDGFAERDRILEAARGGEYLLWFEADLYDQLQIIQILARLAELGVPTRRARQSAAYSSCRRNQLSGASGVRASLRPSGARSSHWYMPQRPSSPRA